MLLLHSSKSTKYYVKELSRTPEPKVSSDLPPRTPSPVTSSTPPPPRATWRIKTQEEYIQSLTPNEIRKKGGLAKLQKQPTNRYFKRKKLTDIIMLHGHCTSNPDLETLGLFAHFLMGKFCLRACMVLNIETRHLTGFPRLLHRNSRSRSVEEMDCIPSVHASFHHRQCTSPTTIRPVTTWLFR